MTKNERRIYFMFDDFNTNNRGRVDENTELSPLDEFGKEKNQKMIEESIIKRDKPLPPTHFNVKTMADVKFPKSQINPTPKIPKQITPENVMEVTSILTSNDKKEADKEENVVELPKAMSKNQINKAIKNINIVRKRRKTKRY